MEQYHCKIGKTEIEFVTTPHNIMESKNDLIIELTSTGRHTKD